MDQQGGNFRYTRIFELCAPSDSGGADTYYGGWPAAAFILRRALETVQPDFLISTDTGHRIQIFLYAVALYHAIFNEKIAILYAEIGQECDIQQKKQAENRDVA